MKKVTRKIFISTLTALSSVVFASAIFTACDNTEIIDDPNEYTYTNPTVQGIEFDVDEEITLDGALTETFWQTNNWHTGTSKVSDLADKTTVLNVTDDLTIKTNSYFGDKGIYFAFECNDKIINSAVKNVKDKTGITIFVANGNDYASSKGNRDKWKITCAADGSFLVERRHFHFDGYVYGQYAIPENMAGHKVQLVEENGEITGYTIELFISYDLLEVDSKNEANQLLCYMGVRRTDGTEATSKYVFDEYTLRQNMHNSNSQCRTWLIFDENGYYQAQPTLYAIDGNDEDWSGYDGYCSSGEAQDGNGEFAFRSVYKENDGLYVLADVYHDKISVDTDNWKYTTHLKISCTGQNGTVEYYVTKGRFGFNSIVEAMVTEELQNGSYHTVTELYIPQRLLDLCDVECSDGNIRVGLSWSTGRNNSIMVSKAAENSWLDADNKVIFVAGDATTYPNTTVVNYENVNYLTDLTKCAPVTKDETASVDTWLDGEGNVVFVADGSYRRMSVFEYEGAHYLFVKRDHPIVVTKAAEGTWLNSANEVVYVENDELYANMKLTTYNGVIYADYTENDYLDTPGLIASSRYVWFEAGCYPDSPHSRFIVGQDGMAKNEEQVPLGRIYDGSGGMLMNNQFAVSHSFYNEDGTVYNTYESEQKTSETRESIRYVYDATYNDGKGGIRADFAHLGSIAGYYAYLTNSTTSGDFVVATDIIASNDSTSPFYVSAVQSGAGLVVSDGYTTVSFMLSSGEKCLRIYGDMEGRCTNVFGNGTRININFTSDVFNLLANDKITMSLVRDGQEFRIYLERNGLVYEVAKFVLSGENLAITSSYGSVAYTGADSKTKTVPALKALLSGANLVSTGLAAHKNSACQYAKMLFTNYYTLSGTAATEKIDALSKVSGVMALDASGNVVANAETYYGGINTTGLSNADYKYVYDAMANDGKGAIRANSAANMPYAYLPNGTISIAENFVFETEIKKDGTYTSDNASNMCGIVIAYGTSALTFTLDSNKYLRFYGFDLDTYSSVTNASSYLNKIYNSGSRYNVALTDGKFGIDTAQWIKMSLVKNDNEMYLYLTVKESNVENTYCMLTIKAGDTVATVTGYNGAGSPVAQGDKTNNALKVMNKILTATDGEIIPGVVYNKTSNATACNLLFYNYAMKSSTESAEKFNALIANKTVAVGS